MNYCLTDTVYIFFHVKVLEVLLRIDCKVLEERIKILSDVFVPLYLCIEKFIFVTVSSYLNTRCWATVLHLV